MAFLLQRGTAILGSRLISSKQVVRRAATVAPAQAPKEGNGEAKSEVVGKTVLAKRLAEANEKLTVKDANEFIDALLDDIMLSVAEGHAVTIPGFGSFKKRTRSARKGRNPQTGEALDIPETVSAGFTAGSVFKGVVKAGSWEAYDEIVANDRAASASKKSAKKK
eukprot:GHRR01001697.1.p1 GENE.GHRR01001697.1~~GHRR01001697.1.p1  ORF type:complete len:165 (+),score=40.03 GHRR01001697.1:246-740(+)